MSNRQFLLGIILSAIFGGFVALGTYKIAEKKDTSISYLPDTTRTFSFSHLLSDTNISVPRGLNFIVAARLVTPGVVHIKSVGNSSGSVNNPFHQMFPDFFNQDPQEDVPTVAIGSGVIISGDGYVATNFHVVEGAEKFEVTLNDNRRYNARVIGTDPNTDLALLKIDEKNLPYVRFGNSDELQIGEWVLAVGNPFELTSTVTAGIVSAKARNINILHTERGVESFIQTDAAVNPGNSGGALVNLKGELVGINTAIATGRTGTYTGYSFAVPASLVQKVMDDLLKYGAVQRVMLGVHIVSVDADFAEQHKIKEHSGVYIAKVDPGSSAEDGGLKEGDIVIGIDNSPVANVSELQEMVARKHPGDKIKITFKRDGNLMTIHTILKNIIGNESIVKKESTMEIDGAVFSELTDDLKKSLHLDGGVQLKEIKSDSWKEAGVREGFIITYVDKISIHDLGDLSTSLSGKNGRYFIEGVYPSGKEDYFRITLNP